MHVLVAIFGLEFLYVFIATNQYKQLGYCCSIRPFTSYVFGCIETILEVQKAIYSYTCVLNLCTFTNLHILQSFTSMSGAPKFAHGLTGAGGCQLSGGQKQRIAIARALVMLGWHCFQKLGEFVPKS